MKPIVIVGAGIAGISLIKNIRSMDKNMPILLVTNDKGHYYSKPMLSNAIHNNQTVDNLILMTKDEISQKYSIRIWDECTAEFIDTNRQSLHTNQGEVSYEKLVLACGSSPITLPLFKDRANIFSINHLNDYAKFRSSLKNKRQITIIGSGLVGSEFANDLVYGGFQITVISKDNYPLEKFVPEYVGLELFRKLASIGVNWYFNSEVTTLVSHEENLQLCINNNIFIKTDIILSSIGLQPNTILAKASKIEINRGIVTDEYLRTSVPNIYSIGDCAEMNGSWRPFILPIREASRVLAKTLLNEPTKFSLLDQRITIKTPIYPISFNERLLPCMSD